MTFFDFDDDPQGIEEARFIGEVQRGLLKRFWDQRKRGGITQAAVARATGIDKSTLTKMLSGKGNLTLRKLAAISWALGLRPQISWVPIRAGGHDLRGSNHGPQSRGAMSPGATMATRPQAFEYATGQSKLASSQPPRANTIRTTELHR